MNGMGLFSIRGMRLSLDYLIKSALPENLSDPYISWLVAPPSGLRCRACIEYVELIDFIMYLFGQYTTIPLSEHN
jgi:hypothetical protein